MHMLISIVGAILAIFIIIILHEMGHLFVARCFGIKILRFSIGFGKALYKYVGKTGTEYVLALIPLGGYVKMLGEADLKSVPATEINKAYHRKPLLVRMAVVAAGPITNFILAILVFWVAYLIGIAHMKPVIGRVVPASLAAKAGLKSEDAIVKVGDTATYNWQQVIMAMFAHMGNTDHLLVWVQPRGQKQLVSHAFDLSHWNMNQRNPEIFASLGMFPYVPPVKPVIATVLPESPAAHAQLKPGDIIKAINGKAVTDWLVLTHIISRQPGKIVTLLIERHGAKYNFNVRLGKKTEGKVNVGYLGVMVTPPKYPAWVTYTEKYNVLTAWEPAVKKTYDLLAYNAIVLVKMITSKLSFKTLGGPISVFQAAGQASVAGWGVYLNFIGFISVTVGFINLLPIPGLDGGHLLFQVIEAMIRRPVPEKIQQYGFTLGMLLVLFIIVHATINDLFRIFSG